MKDTRGGGRRHPASTWRRRMLYWAVVVSGWTAPALAQDPIYTNLSSQIVQALDLDEDGRTDYTVTYKSDRYEYSGRPYDYWRDTVTFRLLPAEGNMVVGRADGVCLGLWQGQVFNEQAPAGARWLADTNGALLAGTLYYREVWPGNFGYGSGLASYPPVDLSDTVGYVAVRFRAKDGDRFGWVRAAMAIQPDPPIWEQYLDYYPRIKLACGPWQHRLVGSGDMKVGEPQPVPKLAVSSAGSVYVRIAWTPQENGCVLQRKWGLEDSQWTYVCTLPQTPGYFSQQSLCMWQVYGEFLPHRSLFFRLWAP